MWSYLPSNSALAPSQQPHNNINFIHKSMIWPDARARRVSFCDPRVGSGRWKRTEKRRSYGARIETVRRRVRLFMCGFSGGTGEKPARRLRVEGPPTFAHARVRVYARGAGRALPGGERTALRLLLSQVESTGSPSSSSSSIHCSRTLSRVLSE